MKNEIWIITALLVLTTLSASALESASAVNVTELPNYEKGKVNIYFFYSPTCPHCRAEEPILKELEKNPQVKIHYYEAAKNPDLLRKVASLYSTKTGGVPRTFIGNKAFIGFTEDSGNLEYLDVYKAYIGYKNQIEKAVKEELLKLPKNNTINVTDTLQLNETAEVGLPSTDKFPLWLFWFVLAYVLSFPVFYKRINNDSTVRRFWIAGLFLTLIIILFLFIALTPETTIKAYAEKLPFPLFVFVIALADGFNPCSFAVLLILLSLLTYTKSRKDMVIFGSTYVIVSGIMYFIFIMVMILVGSWALSRYGHIIIIILGAIITTAGLINIKDYFFFKKGISLTLSTDKERRFTSYARRIINRLREAENLYGYLFALGGTIVLAVMVNLLELGCTAILPVVYMASLISRYGEAVTFPHVIWTIIYSAIYIIPIFAILMNFVYTFKSARLTEAQGRILKLIAGLFMLLFGLIMLFKPSIIFS